ncbi:phospholipase A [Desulfobotulus sp. H1]|uniref:Phosphatidylcholine 1-acylhydrolase n=1 Tax=Desulfobotulus pelophilus TaxID=2823377 RepID=A0ABT3N8P9_9BACT|nr:phospholipase A [Desulfobotulus pelophilus]MCW7753571.1 phospholipase A [Desulfobotulus pelophilus]
MPCVPISGLILSALLLILAPGLSFAEPSEAGDTSDEGYETLLLVNPLEERRKLEKSTADNPFAMLPHKTNYLLPFTWNSSPNPTPEDPDSDIDNTEVHFQISIKVPVLRNFWDGRANLAFAYTNRSWWQAYNKDDSSPFRETNHEPELLLSYAMEKQKGRIHLSHLVLGLNHQSNGQNGLMSRSWNRVYLSSIWEIGDRTAVIIRPWYRIPESKKSHPTDPGGDDNPGIHNYMGYGDIRLVYKVKEEQNLALLLRNNLRGKDNRGAIQVDWTFPVHQHLKLYVQYFNGYGESLLDYNVSVNRIGLGFLLTDWM